MKPTAPQPPSTALRPADQRAGKYLICRLSKEDFAIQVLRIHEIMGVQQVTVVPGTPAYVKGVMNLRGRAIPVIDLRLKLGMAEVPRGPRTSIVVVHVESEGGKLLVGILVDSVSEVLTLESGEIENASNACYQGLVPYLLGVAKIKGRLKFLIDLNLLLPAHDIHNLEAVLV